MDRMPRPRLVSLSLEVNPLVRNGIRSGLVDHETLALFSGAGIVNGSTPDGEWTEIENKIGNFMKAIMQK